MVTACWHHVACCRWLAGSDCDKMHSTSCCFTSHHGTTRLFTEMCYDHVLYIKKGKMWFDHVIWFWVKLWNPKKERLCTLCILCTSNPITDWYLKCKPGPVDQSTRSMPLSVNSIDFCIAVDCPTSGLLTWIFVFFWLKRVQRDFAHFSRMWLEWIHWKKSECHCTPIWETSCLTTTLLVTASSLSIESKEWRTWFEIF